MKRTTCFFRQIIAIAILTVVFMSQIIAQSTISWNLVSGTYNYKATAGITSGNYGTPGSITLGGIYNGVGSDMTIQSSNQYGYGLRDINILGNNTNINGNFLVSGKSTLTGIVAIGSSTIRSGCILTVNGKIAAEEFEIVTDVNAPDFVFENTYKLRSLKDLEDFINQNKHLPEVPSANEFRKNGYKMVEMDNLLLKKIEELTLYTIELNKQVEYLKEELSKVKKANQ